ncbi:MAG: MGMT family protein [Pseudomonadales bacterium]|uniref:6-O-methylguanine DNA-protein cysteine methyltransferase n=1 Tax=Oleiphilus messinensis TaxID=141451 RepID=A0A1Y0IES8_9GAMM|nr:MGMT family protein [Oleiphilus messinensis]ARU58306.1 6-O-methylguanine DNA-protein cysteine methyltransferase [Oleiphilus messinensis]MCG8609193.1 MGMT family protein [Pseudomonadales bacterium]
MTNLTDDKDDRIRQVIAMIPEGRVSTYGNVARMAGLPGYARYVGHLLKHQDACSTLPWHRVISSTGKISLPVDSVSHSLQQQKLEAEGIVFRNGKIDLALYGWLTHNR